MILRFSVVKDKVALKITSNGKTTDVTDVFNKMVSRSEVKKALASTMAKAIQTTNPRITKKEAEHLASKIHERYKGNVEKIVNLAGRRGGIGIRLAESVLNKTVVGADGIVLTSNQFFNSTSAKATRLKPSLRGSRRTIAKPNASKTVSSKRKTKTRWLRRTKVVTSIVAPPLIIVWILVEVIDGAVDVIDRAVDDYLVNQQYQAAADRYLNNPAVLQKVTQQYFMY